jgi:hypothetical protein
MKIFKNNINPFLDIKYSKSDDSNIDRIPISDDKFINSVLEKDIFFF